MYRNFYRMALILLMIICSSTALQADGHLSVPGQTQPEYQLAVQIWLDGNDAAALDALSRLAQNNNRAAQILLARIEANSYLHTHYSGNLPRKDRIKLLRQPGGLSGISWMVSAESDTALAIAFLKIAKAETRVDSVRALLLYGETAVALRAMYPMMINGRAGDVVEILSESSNLPQSVKALYVVAKQVEKSEDGQYSGSALWPRSWFFENISAVSGVSIEDELTWNGVSLGDLLKNSVLRKIAIENTLNVPTLKPLRQFCEAHSGRFRENSFFGLRR